MKKTLFIFLTVVLVALVVRRFFYSRNVQRSDSPVGAIVVGTNAEYRPFTFVNKGEVVGFDIDVIREVFKRLGKDIIIKDMPFDVVIPQVQRGEISVIAAGMTPTEKRKKILLFSQDYFEGDPLVIVSRKNSPVNTVEELFNKDVIVNDGYTADFYMSQYKNIEIKRLPNPAAAFLALKSNRAQAYVAARSAIMPFMKEQGSSLYEVKTIPDTQERYAFAVTPRKPELLEKINTVLTSMKDDGSLSELRKKWEVV